VRSTTTLGNDLAELPAALDWLEALLRAAGVGDAVVGELRLIAEEGLSNVIRHAYSDSARHSIEVVLEIGGGEILLVLRDDGRPFDPLAASPAPDLNAPIERRPAGGLGILLLTSLADRAEYRREGDANVLRLAKRRE
jgi:anti-sigma regulatory factor (Ser/Thr protein kinase)